MNKMTIIVLGVAVVLGVAAFLATRTPDNETVEALKLPPILSDKSATSDEGPKEGAVGPADRIVFVKGGQEYELVRKAEDDWRLARPVEAAVEMTRVRSMLRAFGDGSTSTFARKVDADALHRYGLGEDNRVRVTLLKGEEKLADLLVGNVDRRDENQPDTLVQQPDGEIVYRMKGVDLRSPFDVTFQDLRSKKVFDFDKAEVVKLTITDPRNARYSEIVLEKDEKVESATDPSDAAKWKLVKPTGFQVEAVDTFASSLANLRAEEFMEKLPGADAQALDKAYKVAITVRPKGGKETMTHTLLLGAGRKKGVYATVEGRSEFFVIARYSADQAMKSLIDLREKKLFTFKADDIQEVRIAPAGQEPLHLKQTDGHWTFLSPAGEHASDQKVKSLTNAIANFRVAEFMDKPVETTQSGLGDEATVVTVTLSQQAGGGTATLRLGKEFKTDSNQERYYALREGSEEVFAIMKYTGKNVLKTLDDLKDSRVFRINKEDIQEVTLKHPDGQELTFLKESADSKPVWKMTVPQQKEVTTQMTSILATLEQLDVSATVTDKQPAEVGIGVDSFNILFKMADGSQHSVSISEEVADNANYAITATEPHLLNQLFTISKYKVQNLLKKLPDFEAGS